MKNRSKAVSVQVDVRIAALCFLALVLLLPAAGRAVGEPVLIGTVRGNATIDLRHPNGDFVTNIAPGTYDFEIHDETSGHNFHLTGPGVDKTTDVVEVQTVTWEDVLLSAGSTYSYVCDPHSSFMNGSFTTTSGGTPPPPPPPPPPGPPPPGPPPGPPPPVPPPPPPPSPPPAHVHPLQVSSLRIKVADRTVVARARINKRAVARLVLSRGQMIRRSARRLWAAGPNVIRLRVPRSLPGGRWTAELRVGTKRFKRSIRIG
jgi:hypothetical protein